MIPADVLAVLPAFVKSSDPAPVRDAIVDMLIAMFNNYEAQSQYAASQGTPDKATGIYLKGFASDHGVNAVAGDSDDQLRARIFATPSVVTPAAILSAINAAIAPYSSKLAQLFESDSDCLYISDGTATWDSFIGVAPHYQDRLYHDDVIENNGYERLQSDPGGSWIFADCNGRFLVVRIPNLAATDENFAFVNDESNLATPYQFEFFVGDNSDTSGSETSGLLDAFIFESDTASIDIYNTVASLVERLKPQGYRTAIWVDL